LVIFALQKLLIRQTPMPDFLLQLDRHLFYFINHDLSNAFFDWIMPLMRNPKFWIALYIFIIAFCVYRYKKQGVILVLMLALAAGFADFTSATLIKKTVQRERPCRDVVTSQTVISRCPVEQATASPPPMLPTILPWPYFYALPFSGNGNGQASPLFFGRPSFVLRRFMLGCISR
jgi:hypothetical protein